MYAPNPPGPALLDTLGLGAHHGGLPEPVPGPGGGEGGHGQELPVEAQQRG